MRIGFTNRKLAIIDENTGVLFRRGHKGLLVMCPVTTTELEILIHKGCSEEEWFSCCLSNVMKEAITEIVLE